MHKYFVSYSHSRGFGNSEVGIALPIKSIKDAQAIARDIEKISKVENVVVLKYNLMEVTKNYTIINKIITVSISILIIGIISIGAMTISSCYKKDGIIIMGLGKFQCIDRSILR